MIMQYTACITMVPQFALTNSRELYLLYKTEKTYPPYNNSNPIAISIKLFSILVASMYVKKIDSANIKR